MLMEQATEVRKQWSSICDTVVHERPVFIKRTRDKMWFSNLDTIMDILQGYVFTAKRFQEEDGSITLSLDQMDLIENGFNEEEARIKLGRAILDYATDYYNEYALYSRSPNRKTHIPYVFKALIMDNPQMTGASIECRDGEN